MPAKIVKFPGKRRLPTEVEPAIARLREITMLSANNEFIGEVPPGPDAKLLDLCAEALHLMTYVERALEETRALLAPDSYDREDPRLRARRERLWDERNDAVRKSKPIMRRLQKIPATTAAGVYAKALVVRCSRTAAPILAMSLAKDLIACPGLRQMLWPAGEVQP